MTSHFLGKFKKADVTSRTQDVKHVLRAYVLRRYVTVHVLMGETGSADSLMSKSAGQVVRSGAAFGSIRKCPLSTLEYKTSNNDMISS